MVSENCYWTGRDGRKTNSALAFFCNFEVEFQVQQKVKTRKDFGRIFYGEEKSETG